MSNRMMITALSIWGPKEHGMFESNLKFLKITGMESKLRAGD